jgi:hypothetical protein
VSLFDQPPRYYTFLLTLWEERNQNLAESSVWRFRLQSSRTGKQHGFATLEELMAFLKEETRGESEANSNRSV